MRVALSGSPEYSLLVAELSAPSSLFDPDIEARTRVIVDAVRDRGDAAVAEFTERFDGAKVAPDQMAVTAAEFMAAALSTPPSLRKAVVEAHRNIVSFARRSLRRGWRKRNSHGAWVGEKFDPFERVGIYIPGGTAPLVSTALMTITLAKAAGCPEIVVCTPCQSNGAINPALLHAARFAGATEVYRIGGAQAIAAMAWGTDTVRRVQKVFGPGNAYVVAAKRLLFGHVAVDLLPGPSEVCVLADDSADARFAASDLLAQAEHGSGHERVWLITTSAQVLKAVRTEIERQLPALRRRDAVEAVLQRQGWLIQCPDMDHAIELVNRLAPEHCEVMTRRAATVAARIKTAGALFLGPFSPTVLGDYVAGPSHTLPTGGAGASFAGLTTDQFQRRTSVVEYGKTSLAKALGATRQFAAAEGLDAHGASAAVRLAPAPAKRRSPRA